MVETGGLVGGDLQAGDPHGTATVPRARTRRQPHSIIRPVPLSDSDPNPVELRWRAPEGSGWVVERADRLAPRPQWTVVSDPITAVGGEAAFLETQAPPAAAFYRVRAR